MEVSSTPATLTLHHCVIARNVAHRGGGGIAALGYGTLSLNDTTVSGNSVHASGYGGGIYSRGTTVLNNSTVTGNTILASGYGSGIYTDGSGLVLNNSTVSGNSGGDGVGIYAYYDSIILNNSTITKNKSWGIVSDYAHVSLQNTIIAGNGGNKDCYRYHDPLDSGSITSGGHNLIGNGAGCPVTPGPGDQIGSSAAPIDPLLLPLQANGGPTFTHALRSGSPALNAGNPAEPGSGGNACLATDQRGQPRPEGSACDIGAFEDPTRWWLRSDASDQIRPTPPAWTSPSPFPSR